MPQSYKIQFDDELERRIDREHQILLDAKTPAERRAAWMEFARLVNLRSPERIRQMEREAGLR